MKQNAARLLGGVLRLVFYHRPGFFITAQPSSSCVPDVKLER